MRKALWMFSAPIVAGGLAWAVNAADNHETLLAGAPTAPNGQIYYFSRSGKTSATEADASVGSLKSTYSPSADGRYKGAAGTVDNTDRPEQHYPRTRTTASGRTVRNYYQDLFSDSQPAGTAGASASKNAGRMPPVVTANQQQVVEECGIDEAGPRGAAYRTARETHKLPPAPVEHASGTKSDERDQVRHAAYEGTDAETSRNQVEQIQYIDGQSSGTVSRFTRRKPTPQTTTPALPSDFNNFGAGDPAPAPPAAPATRYGAQTGTSRTATVSKTLPSAVKTPPAAAPATRNTTATASAPAARPSAPPQTRPTTPPAYTRTRTAPVDPVIETTSETEISKPVVEPAHSETTKPISTFRSSGIEMTGAGEAPQVPLISLRWVTHGEVNVGQECKCGLVVKNNGKTEARDILVEAYFPRTVRLLDASPFPTESRDHLTWAFEHFAAGEEKTIEITMIPAKRGELATSATVRFTGVASTVLKVEEPQLSVALAGPTQVMVGESVTSVVTVSNPGSGVAHDVVVNALIPDGLEHARGSHVEIGVGSLGPGETREVRLALAAVASGDSIIQVEARGAGSLIQRTAGHITVAAPKLAVEVTGPALRYVNRHAQYAINIRNDGVAAANNVRVVHVVPEGFGFVRADKGGKYDAASGTVSWYVGRLEAGEDSTIAVELTARQIGSFQHHVQVSGEHGSIANAKLDSRVDGSSAIVMEVVDLDDPVEVGAETAYEIRIRNEGSKAAQNVRLNCELPQGVAVLDITGPSEHRLEKGVLQFRPLEELPAGARTAYRIKISGKVAGNLRMRALLTTNSATEPLVVEELTKFYAD
jgi:uncharacterized repeat protein (TIGR01451 family)